MQKLLILSVGNVENALRKRQQISRRRPEEAKSELDDLSLVSESSNSKGKSSSLLRSHMQN